MLHRFFVSITVVILLGFILVSCAGQGTRLSKPLPLVEEDFQAKALNPRSGSSLVYFYYERYPAPNGTAVALDGAAADVKKDTYLVWEVEPGKHTFTGTFHKLMSTNNFNTRITTEADRTYYYRMYAEKDSSASGSFDVMKYRFLTIKEETGRKKIAACSLMGWFRDNEVVFLRETEPTPEVAQTDAETPILAATPLPEAPAEAAQELPPVPEAASDGLNEAPEIAPVPNLDETEVLERAIEVPGDYYALLIGISEYENLETLPNAVTDTEAVAEALRAYGFKINTLFDDKATRERILDNLEVFQRLLKPEDKLLIYYAGHGVLDADAKDAYWQPVDAKADSMTQWIATDSITALLKRIPANQILVVADSVYSGTFIRPSQADLNSEATRQSYLESLSEKHSRVILSSGTAQPSTVVSDSGLSLFASAFVDGLNGTEQNAFAAEELFKNHILEVVAGQSEQLPSFQALRNSGHEGGDFLFVRE